MGPANELPEFAVRGEQGLDIFWRVDAPHDRSYRYECVATVLIDGPSAELVSHHDHARNHPDRMLAAAQRLQESPALLAEFALADALAFPRAPDRRAQLDVFLYLDFLRCWQIADLEIARMTEALQGKATIRPSEISRFLRLVLDYNQVQRCEDCLRKLAPYLIGRSAEGLDDRWQNAAYSLRMMGDLHMRAGRAKAALASYEAALALGDNPHRRELAIRAADAATDRAALANHLACYEQKWALPDRLKPLRHAISPLKIGEYP